MSVALYATCLDASALAKNFVEENGSEDLRRYWRAHSTLYTTPFCFYESLGILKRHWLKAKLTKDEYFRAAEQLVAWYREPARTVKDLDFTKIDIFSKAKKIADQHDLDLSDAFQLLSLEEGFFSPLVHDSATLLVTADEHLAKVARTRTLRVWDCLREPMPRF